MQAISKIVGVLHGDFVLFVASYARITAQRVRVIAFHCLFDVVKSFFEFAAEYFHNNLLLIILFSDFLLKSDFTEITFAVFTRRAYKAFKSEKCV